MSLIRARYRAVNTIMNLPSGGGYVGLLDLFPNAAAAYSLRKLRAAYSGAAVRVRKEVSLVSSETDIGFLADGTLDTVSLLAFASDADSGDVFVVTWYDQSLSNDATQGTAASQPKIVDAGSLVVENGKPAIEFDGAKELVANGLSGSVVQDTYFVMKYTSGGDPERMSMYDLYSNATNRYSFYADSGDGGIAFSNYGSPILYKNSSLQTITNRADVYQSLVTNSQILRVDENANTSTWLDISFGFWFSSFGYIGTLQEWIIYPSDQSSNRTAIETNINNFYSIYP